MLIVPERKRESEKANLYFDSDDGAGSQCGGKTVAGESCKR
jgi:hypothetical protein